jgi:hypothetical protein
MATTTNYGWTTPDDTALVKDGASAIRSLGTSVDTTTKNLNPSTTLGDIEYRSSTANTNTRLAIGANNQTLTVVSGVPAWTDGVNLIIQNKTDNYTVALTDAHEFLTMNAGTAKTFSIPTDATANFPIGTQIHFAWITGAGQPTISASTPGTTTIVSTGAASASPKLRVANSAATAIKLAANSWLVVGDLA